jgi:hypothetical protein
MNYRILLIPYSRIKLIRSDRMPGFVLFHVKRPQIDVHTHLELPLEPIRHPPRVQASAASAIFELAGFHYAARFIYDLERCLGRSPSILQGSETVQLS